MKNLIFTACYGTQINFDMTNAMVANLRVVGYTSDIIVLSDKNWMPADKDVRVIVISNPEGPILWKASLPEGVAKGYDAILYVDSDGVWWRSPDTILALVSDKLIISRIRFQLQYDLYNLRLFSATERKLLADGGLVDPKQRSINAGAFLIRGEKYTTMCAIWKKEWTASSKPELHVGDQPPLQLLICQKQIEYDYFPENMVLFPKVSKFALPDETTVFAHFAGFPANDVGTKDCIAAMADYPATVKRITDAIQGQIDKGKKLLEAATPKPLDVPAPEAPKE